ncbi:hypothetical protein AMECASPLE_005484 [Ameca splendens]|uniref:Uncharacterized protein n=1 Tax=Ameca splendens TaxID=208324 RepID=A0ABV0YL84_9TELE
MWLTQDGSQIHAPIGRTLLRHCQPPLNYSSDWITRCSVNEFSRALYRGLNPYAANTDLSSWKLKNNCIVHTNCQRADRLMVGLVEPVILTMPADHELSVSRRGRSGGKEHSKSANPKTKEFSWGYAE